jgi:cation diffusion facilitator CzcD-associated flavoprotein CzcO
MDVSDRKCMTMTAPLRVCIIGGGPAAMFFCHAWNQQTKSVSPQQQLQELDITCFEMKLTPGGIWRAPSNTDDHVYDELWTNGVVHNLNFFIIYLTSISKASLLQYICPGEMSTNT